MHKYVFRRLLLMIPVILGVTFIIFSMMYFTPGDPARIILGESAKAEDVARLRDELGLNDPYFVQFGNYVKKAVLEQDIGNSYATKRPVVTEITDRFPTTLKLAALSIVIAVAIGIPVGIVSATKQYSLFDNISMVLALMGMSMPNFWQGLLLILFFSVYLGWLPSSGFSSFKHMILPAVTIGTSTIAVIARMTRSSMLEVIRQDYIRTARAKGQVESKVINHHALKNALIPIITVVGIQFGYLLSGAVLTESIFAVPGVGRLMVTSIKERDFPVVQGSVLFIAVAFSLVNLMVDILYAFVDPRIRSQYK